MTDKTSEHTTEGGVVFDVLRKESEEEKRKKEAEEEKRKFDLLVARAEKFDKHLPAYERNDIAALVSRDKVSKILTLDGFKNHCNTLEKALERVEKAVEKSKEDREKAVEKSKEDREKAVEKSKEDREKAKKEYETAQKNVELLGVELNPISATNATKKDYDSAIEKAMVSFEQEVLHHIPISKPEPKIFRAALTSIDQKPLINVLNNLVDTAKRALVGHVLTDDGIKELPRLQSTTSTGLERLKAAVKVFQDSKKISPSEWSSTLFPRGIAHAFLRYQGVDQVTVLTSPFFHDETEHTEGLKNLTAYLIKHSSDDPLIAKLDHYILQCIAKNFIEGKEGIDQERFKQEFIETSKSFDRISVLAKIKGCFLEAYITQRYFNLKKLSIST